MRIKLAVLLAAGALTLAVPAGVVIADHAEPSAQSVRGDSGSAAQQESEGAEEESEEGNEVRQRDYWFNKRRRGATAAKWIEAGRQADRLATASLLADQPRLGWSELGPRALGTPVTNLSWIYGGSTPYSGRVNVIANHPTNSAVAYLGSDHGGVYKTTNSGGTWTPVFDNAPAGASLKIGAIAIDPNAPERVYVGTGDPNSNRSTYFGTGIYKSEDGGGTWSKMGGATFDGCNITSIVVRRGASQQIVVGSVGGRQTSACSASRPQGVLRTTDGGANWTRVTTAPDKPSRIVAAPNAPATLFGGFYGSGVWKSTDFGANWSRLSNGIATSATVNLGRVEVSTVASSAMSTTQVVVAEVASSGGGIYGIYASSDGGDSWRSLPRIGAALTFRDGSSFGFCGGSAGPQCNYDLAIAADPTSNARFVAAGSLLVRYQSDAPTLVGFHSPGSSGCPYHAAQGTLTNCVHVDVHAVSYDAAGRVWMGSDGGVWRSSDSGSTWLNLNAGLGNIQVYPGVSGNLSPGPLVAGEQDNGSAYRSASGSFQLGGDGDGGYSAVTANGTTVFTSSQYLSLNKIQNGAVCPYSPTSNDQIHLVSGESREFIAPLVVSPSNSNLVYAGSSRIWKSTNPGAACNATTWQPASDWFTYTTTSGTQAQALIETIGPAYDGATVYASDNVGRVWASSGSTSWANRSSGLPGRIVTDFAIWPNNPSIVYAAVGGFGSGHVFKTTNGGVSWASISGNLPNSPASAILVDPASPATLYVGTDAGVFWTQDGGTTWNNTSDGLPNTPVTDLLLDKTAGKIIGATFGRGLWTAPRVGGAAPGPTNDTLANARPINSLPFNVTGVDTSQATASGEPDPSGCPDSSGKTVWYRYSPSTDTSVLADTIGSSFDTVLAVYKGTNLADLVEVACNDDGQDTAGPSKLAPFVARAGTTYWFQVGGYAQTAGDVPTSGSLTLNVTGGGPVNDAFSDATQVASLPFTVTAPTSGAGAQAGENVDPSCTEFVGSTVWYHVVPAADTSLAFDTGGSSFDTVLRVLEGSSLASLVEVACNDDGLGASGASKIASVNLLGGHSYYVQAGGWTETAGGAAPTGTLTMHVARAAPANDLFASATPVSSIPATLGPLSNVFATTDTGEPLAPACADGIGKTLWFKLTPAASTSVSIDTSGSTFDTVLVAYSGTALGSLTQLRCNDDGIASGGASLIRTMNLVGGQTYYIQAGGYANATSAAAAGSLTVHFTAE